MNNIDIDILTKTIENTFSLMFSKRLTSKRAEFKCKTNRQEKFQEMINSAILKLHNVKLIQDPKISSVGYLQLNDGLQIVLRPEGNKTGDSLNKQNEVYIKDNIEKLAKVENINIVITDGTRHITALNVGSAIDNGTNTRKDASGLSNKADIILVGDTKVPLSIKLPNAAFYASYSSDKEVAKIALRALHKAHSKDKTFELLEKGSGLVQMNKARIGVILTDKTIIEDGLFGNDIVSGKGAVITYSMNDSKFVLIDNSEYAIVNDFATYELKVKMVIRDMRDVTKEIMKDKYPVLSLQNHANKRIDTIKGIEARLSTTANIGKHILLNQSDL